YSCLCLYLTHILLKCAVIAALGGSKRWPFNQPQEHPRHKAVLSLGDDARVSSSPLRSQFPSIISNHTLCSYTNDYRTHAEPEKEKLSSNTLPPANIDKSHTESQ